jgi:hypothetical protein
MLTLLTIIQVGNSGLLIKLARLYPILLGPPKTQIRQSYNSSVPANVDDPGIRTCSVLGCLQQDLFSCFCHGNEIIVFHNLEHYFQILPKV